MPGLREDVYCRYLRGGVAPPGSRSEQHHDIRAVEERGGVNASKAEVERVLDQLKEQRDITLAVDSRSGLVVQDVDQGAVDIAPQPLC